jgi:hypothetical protein
MVVLMIMGLFELFVVTQFFWLILPPDWVFYVGMYYFFKGGSSILGGFAFGIPFDILGIIDVLVACYFIFGWNIPYVWFFLLLKGLYSTVIGMGSFMG